MLKTQKTVSEDTVFCVAAETAKLLFILELSAKVRRIGIRHYLKEESAKRLPNKILHFRRAVAQSLHKNIKCGGALGFWRDKGNVVNGNIDI